jgi:lipid II isoglutaminyl synthase (glutamine-hydrolysing)
MSEPRVDIILIYPELLGLYGDRGNALALRHRARRHRMGTRVVEVPLGRPVPDNGDIYLVGGAEDSSMLVARDALAATSGLRSAIEQNRPCLAVCAGLQLLSRSFRIGEDTHAGLGILDVSCERLAGPRAVGEVIVDGGDAFGAITGFENHAGNANLGPQATPLGQLKAGTGNGDGRTEGAVQGSVLATYLHGPVLVRNPRLADHLLSAAIGRTLPVLVDAPVERLRRERLRTALPLLRRGR